MGDMLDGLRRLQDIELQLNSLRQDEERHLRQVRSADRQIQQINNTIDALRADHEKRKRDAEQFSEAVKTRESAVLKHREALLQARTNKDYAAILTSINTEKADSAKLEQQALEKLSELDGIQAKIDEQVANRQAIEKRRETALERLESHRQQNADERNSLERQRQEAASGLPPTILSTFERIAEKHEGEALVELVRLHPKREEYACSGCNITVTLEHIMTLKSRDEVQFCGMCGRILYLPAADRAGAK
jgi:predicted  nucleic acid-binding Zn-ribbon protein